MTFARCSPLHKTLLQREAHTHPPTMAPNDNFISRAVNNGVATAGSYAGGVVDAAGKSVSGAGRGVGDRYVTFLPLSTTCFLPSILSLPLSSLSTD